MRYSLGTANHSNPSMNIINFKGGGGGGEGDEITPPPTYEPAV